MKKRHIFITTGIVVMLVVGIFVRHQLNSSQLNSNDRDLTTIAYRTERKPIETRFPDMPLFNTCYWKADFIGRTDFGPTNYWMKGFLILEEDAFRNMLDEYDWGEAAPAFHEYKGRTVILRLCSCKRKVHRFML